jgi:hypothetical protein
MIPNNAIKVSLLKQRFERFERKAVLQHVNPEYPVVELGACIGVVACITNGILKNPVLHVVVEANPHVSPDPARQPGYQSLRIRNTEPSAVLRPVIGNILTFN